jgi:UDP-N-acetylmuramate--alanine ligase
MHNVLNALSAIAVAVELNIPDDAVQGAGSSSRASAAASRATATSPCRAQGGGKFTVIEDYGHHPVEMAATLAAARGAFPGRRIVLAFQPHRYTRTRDCFEDFVKVLGTPTRCCCPRSIRPARNPSSPPTAARWRARVRVAGKVEPQFVDDIAAMPQAILDIVRDGDVVMCMGAGSIGGGAGQAGRECKGEAA